MQNPNLRPPWSGPGPPTEAPRLAQDCLQSPRERPGTTHRGRSTSRPTGVKTDKICKGRIFGGVQGYLEGIFGDPSLTKIQGKTKKNLRKYKKNRRKTKQN